MKIEFIRKFRDKEIGVIEDVPDRVGHRYIGRGMAKLVEIKPKIIKKYTKKKTTKKNLFKHDKWSN